MDNLRSEPWMQTVLNKAKDQERFHNSDNRKLRSFLRGDQANEKTLHHRGTYLPLNTDTETLGTKRGKGKLKLKYGGPKIRGGNRHLIKHQVDSMVSSGHQSNTFMKIILSRTKLKSG